MTVNAVATSGTTTDAEARFGRVLGIFPASGTAANAVLQSVVLTASTGAIVVTLGAATTNAQVFSVVVALASGDIV